MFNLQEIIIFVITIFFILVLLSTRRKCYYCNKTKFITGAAFDKVMCVKCKKHKYGEK